MCIRDSLPALGGEGDLQPAVRRPGGVVGGDHPALLPDLLLQLRQQALLQQSLGGGAVHLRLDGLIGPVPLHCPGQGEREPAGQPGLVHCTYFIIPGPGNASVLIKFHGISQDRQGKAA